MIGKYTYMKKGILATLLLLATTVGNVFSQSMLISGGNDHAVALCSKGQIFAWGYNDGNRLGLKAPYSGQEFVTTPQKVDIPIGLTFSQVTAGSGSSNIALACTGVVYAWGDNAVGTAGQPITKKVIDKPMPVPCGEATDHGFDIDGVTPGQYLGGVKMVAGTTSAGIALLDDGKAVMWGGNGRWESGPTFPLFKTEVNDYPVYIKDKNGDPIENIIHISGGDNNVLLIVGDSKDASVGIAYSLGSANGRGVAASTSADRLGRTYYAAPVEILDDAAFATGTVSSTGKYLEKVKTTGISDKGGFAVDENTGYLYGWGPNGWNGCIGLEKQSDDYTYAAKVLSGEYSTISGEAYMTNVHQVIGGNGYGACVTEDHYMLYWGVHTPDQKSGGVVPNSTWANKTGFNGTVIDPGPVFANYCKGEKDPTKEVRVDDAMAIGRGDLFGFMVNMDGDFYVWGNSLAPGNEMPITGVGALGLGFVGKNDDPQGTGYRTCLSKITLDCDPQDECPKVFMIGPRYKCPGEADSLYCGFTPTTRSVRNYYFRWSLNGVVKNKSTLQEAQDVANGIASAAVKDNVTKDPWNNWIVEVKDPGKYSVEIFYVGNNVPCTNCETAEGEIDVIDMDMPIDIDTTLENCVADTMKPASSDVITFSATVNDKFYKATDNVTFAVFATPTSTDTLKDTKGKTLIFNTTGAGGKIGEFTIFGNNIDRTLGVEPRPGIDTLYHVWLEDITKFNTQLIDQTNSKSTNNGERCLILKLFSTSELTSFSVYAEGNTNNEATITITPVVYKAGKVKDGNYTLGAPFWTGDAQPFTIEKGENDGGTQITKKIECVVKCGVQLPGNPARGTEYVLSAIIKFRENGNYFLNTLPAATNMYFGTPIDDSKGYGVQAVGTFAANGTGGGYSNTDGVPFYNINFGKMTDYDCGRIPLSARYYCPPCNNPDKLEIVSTSHTIKSDVDPKYKKVVELCKESAPLDLDIEPLVGKTDPAATFDILWYDEDPQKNAAATALKKDETGTVNTLLFSTDWATVAGATDITEDAEKVYYVYVHDHEKVGCPNYDSIKVIAHPAPVDTLAWDTFCLTTPPAGDPVLTIDNKTITWTGVDPTGTIPALTATTSFPHTVTDDKTGCVSEPHTFTVTVNSTDKPKVDQAPSTTVDANGLFSLTTTISTETSAILSAPGSVYEIRWFDDTKSPTSKDVSRATAGTYTFYAQLYNTETECASEMVEITLTINDALPPRVINESLCLGDNIPDITEYVTKTLKPGETDADYELLWYSDLNDATPIAGFNTAFDATTEGEGERTIYVSQKSTTAPFAESAKTPLTITVHKVATLDLTANRTDYCVTDVAESLTFSQNSDGDFSTAMWSTSLKSTTELNNPSATLSPNIIKGTTKYYVLPEFTNSSKEKNYASAVCYGTIQDIDINVNFTDIPNPDKPIVEVQYLKAQGDLLNRYDDLLTQDPTSVTPDANCTLKWFDASQSPLTAVPAPDYIANETGERRVVYWVSQYNTITGCESEMKKVVAVISSIPMPTTKAITLCQGSSKLDSPFKLDAQINTANGAFSESDFKLVWYKENPDKKATATAYNEIDLSQENLDYDYTTETEKDFVYYVRQVETRTGGDESPTATLVVSIYSKPILTTTQPAPICIGEFVDIKNLYEISNRIDNKTYENEYLSATGRDPVNGIAKENGVYKSRAYFTLESGETCVSDWANVTLTVNELKIEIKGDDKTCPNIGKDMEALVTSKNMLPTDNPTYTWNVSPTGEIEKQKIFNMSNNGLANKGDKLTISLNVEMGACKATASHILTVEDPGVNGNISFDEEENTNSGNGKYSLSSTGIVEFDGCNRKVDVAFEVDQTEEDFTYTNLESGLALPGKFTNGKGEISVKAGLYEVSYTNTCKTSFKFDIKDKSLNIVPLWSNLVVCEGEPWNIEIKNSDLTNFVFDPNKYKKIEWKRDNDVLSQFNNKEVLNIPQTSPSDNGIYSCIVQSSGCTSKLVVGMGGSFTSKPKVTVNEALLENGGNYEAIRTKDKKITIPFLNPTGAADLAKLESNTVDGIIWKENGVQVNAGATYDIKNVVSDHEYNVVIARGQGGSSDDFCGTSVKINLKVDALLAINTSMVDEAGKEATDMCINEEGTGILIDTTGTGNVLHPENLTLKVVEKIDNQTKDIPIKAKEDKLFAEISPSKSATYDIVYKYTVGNQDSSKSAKITVHPAYEVEWDKNVRLCEGESGYIEIKKKEPANVTLTWQPDPCISKSSENGATVTAILSGDDVKEEKKLALVASNNGICADKTYYPSFIIDKSIEGEIVAPEYICEKHTATLYAKYDATDYVWSSTDQLGEGVTLKGQTVNVTPKTGYASYIVDMKRGACTLSDEVDIDVREAPKFDRIDSVTYKSIEIVLQASTGTAPFQYIVDNNPDEFVMSNVKEGLDYGEHNISVIDDAKCKIDTIVYINNPGITIPIVVSPNDDNVHDKFVVPNLKEAYPDAKIRIFDRWGKQLTEYRAGDEGMDWDGTYNGVAMPSTDYWYEIQIKEIQKTYTGHFTLIRQ